MTRCERCSFCWQDDGESFPTCHYESLGTWDPAPCEMEDDVDE